MARCRRVQRRREDADQRGLALRDRAGARLDAADRSHVRADEDALHRRRGPRLLGHGGLAGALRAEAAADGGGLREGDPDHAPRGGRRPIPRPHPGDDDAEPGVAGGSPRMSYVDDMRRELELLVKHHRDVPLPSEKVPDFRTFRGADTAKDMIAVDGSYSFLLNLSRWWLALISVGLLRYAFDGHAFRRKDWRLVQRMVGVSTFEEFVRTKDSQLHAFGHTLTDEELMARCQDRLPHDALAYARAPKAAEAVKEGLLYGDIYYVRLHPRARKWFRVDLGTFRDRPDEAFGQLAAYAKSLVSVGYPWPLIEAHRMAVTVRQLKPVYQESVIKMALRMGLDVRTVLDGLTQVEGRKRSAFHEYLDKVARDLR